MLESEKKRERLDTYESNSSFVLTDTSAQYNALDNHDTTEPELNDEWIRFFEERLE